MSDYPTTRLRRLRKSAAMRNMVASVHLRVQQLIAPLFVCPGSGIRTPISSMPEQSQFSVDTALETVKQWADLGIPAVLLFGIPENKDEIGSAAWDDSAPVQQLIGRIKSTCPEMLVITDACLCEYTSHGHCGTLRKHNGQIDVDNDATLASLARTAVSHARCGADIIAPSAMMDGQVQAIRSALDDAGHGDTAILSYAVKFASSMYGPFRDAAQSPPQFGNRKSYQMDYRSPEQAVMEAKQDLAEGADMVMVKPALTYLDIIAKVRQEISAPLAAYHVSGEYSQIHAAAANGWLDLKDSAMEATLAIRRAGADMIITYFAERLARWLDKE